MTPCCSSSNKSWPSAFWSPNSRYIGFFAQGKLKKIAVGGGPAQSLCDVPDGRGGSWNHEDTIVFSPGGTGAVAIRRVSSAGGAPADVTRTKGFYKHPAFLPDGRHFLYLVFRASPQQNGVYLGSLDGKENRRVLQDESSAVFAAGQLLSIRENTLMTQSFDAASAQALGEVFPFAEGVSLTSDGNYAPVQFRKPEFCCMRAAV